ncbi:uncharacterized protein LOC134460005 [Engraulis encrasicolus]|uniref:uncharacterized protein LOC134442726 n=1 Tax=Engraulis encrasicolus TaxID=184585 RepID=UPI002FD38413
MDRDVVLEGLSALLGVTISRQSSQSGQVSHGKEKYALPILYRGFTAAVTEVGKALLGGLMTGSFSNVIPLLVTKLTSLALGYFFEAATADSGPSATAHGQDFSVDEEEFFDPQYDYDFRYMADSSVCKRGDETYRRPVGWYRVALKVRGKYPDGDTWLGTDGWRSESCEGEWPVAFHGTTSAGAKSIIQEGFRPGTGVANGREERAAYGRGVYCTPDIDVAERDGYARTITSKKSGKTYKFLMQGRINPQYREICLGNKDYWLIPVCKRMSMEEERDLLDRAIRPYGILFKKIED